MEKNWSHQILYIVMYVEDEIGSKVGVGEDLDEVTHFIDNNVYFYSTSLLVAPSIDSIQGFFPNFLYWIVEVKILNQIMKV